MSDLEHVQIKHLQELNAKLEKRNEWLEAEVKRLTTYLEHSKERAFQLEENIQKRRREPVLWRIEEPLPTSRPPESIL